MLASGETDRLERKERLAGDAADTIRQAICAFANDLPDHKVPGVVILGMTDTGNPPIEWNVNLQFVFAVLRRRP